MTWLDDVVREKLEQLPKDAFVDRTFGFGDIQSVIALAEDALTQNYESKMAALHETAMKAARDPFHDFSKNPVFAPMASTFWKANQAFPRIVRNALFIAIYSHTEALLLSWCESIASHPQAPTLPKKKGNESHLLRYLRYLVDDLGLPIANFAEWPEWQVLDACRRARNCLAHDGGVIDDADDKIKIAALSKVIVDESRLHMQEPIVLLLPGACEAAAANSQAFIARISAVAEREMKEAEEPPR